MLCFVCFAFLSAVACVRTRREERGGGSVQKSRVDQSRVFFFFALSLSLSPLSLSWESGLALALLLYVSLVVSISPFSLSLSSISPVISPCD